jgi:hypothetical protein
MFKRIGMAAALAAMSAPALACSCVPVKTDAEKQERKQNYANRSVKLKLTSFRLRITPDHDPTAEALAEVLEQPKIGARYPSRIVVESNGGDENANCGRASTLFIAASTQLWIRVEVVKGTDGRYGVWACSPMDMEPGPNNAASLSHDN